MMDGGFTVAGELILTDSLGGHNALAVHYRSKGCFGGCAKLFRIKIG